MLAADNPNSITRSGRVSTPRIFNSNTMSLSHRWSKRLIFGALSLWGLVFISCVVVGRTALAPPKIAGATFVGTKECIQCHSDQTEHFTTASHARIAIADAKVGATGCEACHGPASLHVKSGGGPNTIINPRRSPETCFQCHTDKRGQFSLPNSHPVMAGKVSCADCHNPHEGNAVPGSGAALADMAETCTKCHTAQKGPFVFEHAALREGCTVCHSPHGSVNQKMLVARDANLCLRCHLQAPDAGSSGQINANAILRSVENHNTRLMQGTCWSAGCHEAPHGSNASYHFRN
jgi:predicted CXXCH cytochrome family protein